MKGEIIVRDSTEEEVREHITSVLTDATGEEENSSIKKFLAKDIILVYKDAGTKPELKQKILDEVFSRVTIFESALHQLYDEAKKHSEGAEESYWKKLLKPGNGGK